MTSADLSASSQQKTCGVMDWGLEPYARVISWQKELVTTRKAGAVPDLLLLGEHSPVITLGRNARRENIRPPLEEIAQRGVELHETDRGGDVTYHGPGQLVGYPILDLGGHRKDVVWYVRSLEEVLIRAARDFGLEAKRRQGPAGKRPFYTGVWMGEEKLAAIGVHISRWVTSHGFAFNVTTDLSHFDLIVPCGIADKGVTSLERLLGRQKKQIPRSARDDSAERELMAAVKAAVVNHFGEVFDRQMKPIAPETWEAWIGAQQATAS